MGEENLSQQVLSAIKAKKIKPIPKWEFLLKSYIIWALFILAIIFGSLATSVILFILLNNMLPEDLTYLQTLIVALPYFWIVILAVFVFIAYYNFRNTKQGYRHNPYLVLVMSILISIIIGSIVYAAGGGEKLEKLFYAHMPFYQKVIHQQGRILIDPKYGRIAGDVVKIEMKTFLIRDFYGHHWVVTYPTTSPEINQGSRLIIHGHQISEGEFKADNIRILYGRRGIIERRFRGIDPESR